MCDALATAGASFIQEDKMSRLTDTISVSKGKVYLCIDYNVFWLDRKEAAIIGRCLTAASKPKPKTKPKKK